MIVADDCGEVSYFLAEVRGVWRACACLEILNFETKSGNDNKKSLHVTGIVRNLGHKVLQVFGSHYRSWIGYGVMRSGTSPEVCGGVV